MLTEKREDKVTIEDASEHSENSQEGDSVNNDTQETGKTESSDEGNSDGSSGEEEAIAIGGDPTVESISSSSDEFASDSDTSDDMADPLPSDRGQNVASNICITNQFQNLGILKEKMMNSRQEKQPTPQGQIKRKDKEEVKTEEKDHFANFE